MFLFKCINREYRIKGRVVPDSSLCNDIYPKFIITVDDPPLIEEIRNPTELSEIQPGTRVYEPNESGLGTITEIMYVLNKKRVVLFNFTDVEQTWGSYVTFFGSPLRFEGTLVECPDDIELPEGEWTWGEDITFVDDVLFG